MPNANYDLVDETDTPDSRIQPIIAAKTRKSISNGPKKIKYKRAREARHRRSVSMTFKEAGSKYLKHISDLERSRFLVILMLD